MNAANNPVFTMMAGLLLATSVAFGADAPANTTASSTPTQTTSGTERGLGAALASEEASADAGAARGQRRGGRRGGGANSEDVQAVAAAVAATPAVPPGPYEPTWESVSRHDIPDWYQDAKFGISMHWGLYAVPATASEWYVRHMYTNNAVRPGHVERFGPLDQFGYKDFIPMFTAEKFNADEWAELFKKSGAKYVMPSAEHHDGFSLWDSAANRYNAKNMGPKRDLIGELAAAVRKQGLKFGVTSHNFEHFDFIMGGVANGDAREQARAELIRTAPDISSPEWAEFYSIADHSQAAREKFYTKWLQKNFELIEQYQIDTLWWDNGVNARTYDPLKLKVFAYFYNRAKAWGKDVTIITKGDASLGGHVEDYERQSRAPTTIQEKEFEVHDSPGYRWGYLTRDDGNYRAPSAFINQLIENVSKNGNLLLNLGPRADGTIPDEQKNILLVMGKWLDQNGEAIYGTRAWTKFGEGQRGQSQVVRFTRKGDTLYAILMGWPQGGQAVITSLAIGADTLPAGKIEKVELLGHAGVLEFTQDAEGLKVKLPPEQPGDYAFPLKITGLKPMQPAHPLPAATAAGVPQ